VLKTNGTACKDETADAMMSRMNVCVMGVRGNANTQAHTDRGLGILALVPDCMLLLSIIRIGEKKSPSKQKKKSLLILSATK
jgi:hypothetical protein